MGRTRWKFIPGRNILGGAIFVVYNLLLTNILIFVTLLNINKT
jgi:hypothetical protein